MSSFDHPPTRLPQDRTPAAPTVVIADDEAHIRLLVGDKLRSAGFEVIEARDGEEALELVRRHRPCAVVTDLQMPYKNGLELCTQLASDPQTRDIPAILLTARGHIIDQAAAARTIIRKTMAKPFSAKTLLESVRALTGQGGPAALPGSPANPVAATFPTPLTGEAA